jgi:hypothetical protein
MAMQKQILAAGFFLLSFMLPLKATAATLFSGLYIFGDSISTQLMFSMCPRL